MEYSLVMEAELRKLQEVIDKTMHAAEDLKKSTNNNDFNAFSEAL